MTNKMLKIAHRKKTVHDQQITKLQTCRHRLRESSLIKFICS